jgi:hypothetical protein
MDPVKLMQDEQSSVRSSLASDPAGVGLLARYLDMEERVLFDFYARQVGDDDALARAREEHQALAELLRSSRKSEGVPADVVTGFEQHADLVNRELLAELVTHVDATRYEDLGDALEEARQSWDEQEQEPHLRVGRATDDDAPGAPLEASDDPLPAAPEPNEPA